MKGIKCITPITFLAVISLLCFTLCFSFSKDVIERYIVKDKQSVSEGIVNDASGNQNITESNSLMQKLTNYIDKLDSKFSNLLTSSTYIQDAIAIHTKFKYQVNGTINGSNVLSGKDGWLFYQCTTDGDSLADFRGTNHLTDNEKAYCLDISKEVRDYFAQQGIRFLLMIPPNKERVYSNMMPDHISKENKESRIDLLVEYFKEHSDIDVVYPYEQLVISKENFQVYYKYDTHWNLLGGFIGEQELLKAIGLPYTELQAHNITDNGILRSKGLAKMVHLEDMMSDDVEFTVDGLERSSLEDPEDILELKNDSAKNDVNILFIGDSFRTAMIPYLNNDFTFATILHTSYFNSSIIEEIKPSVIVYECVERYAIVEAFEAMARKLIN